MERDDAIGLDKVFLNEFVSFDFLKEFVGPSIELSTLTNLYICCLSIYATRYIFITFVNWERRGVSCFKKLCHSFVTCSMFVSKVECDLLKLSWDLISAQVKRDFMWTMINKSLCWCHSTYLFPHKSPHNPSPSTARKRISAKDKERFRNESGLKTYVQTYGINNEIKCGV